MTVPDVELFAQSTQEFRTVLNMGAIALFIVLALVMYVTRKVDWYARDAGSQ